VNRAADDPGASIRFAQRYKEKKFSFMWPEKIRDKRKHRPTDDNYDPSTCHIPDDWFKTNKISDGQQQWWTFKGDNWDSVLLFKMGKCVTVVLSDTTKVIHCLWPCVSKEMSNALCMHFTPQKGQKGPGASNTTCQFDLHT
jgi:hypothetical protein